MLVGSVRSTRRNSSAMPRAISTEGPVAPPPPCPGALVEGELLLEDEPDELLEEEEELRVIL